MTGCKMCGLWHGAIRPAGRPKKAWRDIVEKDCQSRQLNKEDAMGHSKWRKLESLSINDKNRERVGECFCDTGSPWLSWIESHEKMFVFVEFKRLAKKWIKPIQYSLACNGSIFILLPCNCQKFWKFFCEACWREGSSKFLLPSLFRASGYGHPFNWFSCRSLK